MFRPILRPVSVLGLLLASVWASVAQAKPVVAVSVLPQAYFVEKIAGDRVQIEVLIPPGANEANFEPTIQQMQAIGRAQVYVKVGHHHFLFETAWLDRLLGEASGIRVVDGSAGIQDEAEDPHVWVSPGCVRTMSTNIARALMEVMPDQKEIFQANLAAFHAEIDALDQEIRTMLAPYAGREFLVLHPSWGLFARDYKLVQLAIASESKEPSPQQLAQLMDHARAKGLKIVFAQPQFAHSQADLIAQQIGGRVLMLDPLARDWTANLRKVAQSLRDSFQE